MSTSEPRIDHLVYNRTWNPDAGESIDVLHSTRIAYITLDSFKKSDKKYYFCPNCGYPGIRSPKDRAFADNGSPAILKHNSQYPHIQCDLKVTSKELGKHFSNECIKRKAVENETLIVIYSWSDGPKGGPLDKPGNYSGVIENPDSPIPGGTIGRYVWESYSLTSESQSLTRMAWNLNRFWTRSIWLPDYSEPQHIYDIYIYKDKTMLTQLQEPTTVRADQLDQLLLKRPITVKALVTPLWKDEAQQQLQAQINQLDGQLQQLDEQVQQMIGKLQQQSLQIVGVGGNSGETQAQIQNIQMQAGDRKDELLDQKNQILQQMTQVQALELGQEVEQGQVDSFFHAKKGDHLIRRMQVEVLLRDGVIVEIRGDL
jgi:hypothetical protein